MLISSKGILIVEDEPLAAMNLESILADAGYQNIRLADCAEAAFKAMADTVPGLIITDLDLGGDTKVPLSQRIEEGGCRVIEKAKKAGIPILVVSGSVAVLKEIPCSPEVLRDVPSLDKPLNPFELLAKVETLMGVSAQTDDDPTPMPRDAAMSSRVTSGSDYLQTLGIGKS